MKKRYFIQLVYTSLVQLLLAFIVLSLVLNFFVMSYIEDEIKSNDRELVDLVQKSVDRQLASMERITKALVYNPTFTPYILLENPYKAYEAREILKTIAVANPLMEAIGISYYFDDYLLTNETSALKSRYYKSMGFDADQLEERNLLEKGYVINSEYIIFLVSMSHGIHSAPGYFFYVFKKETLGKGLFPENNGDGKIRYASLSGAGGETFADNFPENGLDPGDFILSRFNSSSMGMVYSFYTPKQNYKTFVKQLFLLFLFSITLSILLGGLAALFFSRINYAPIRHLSEILNTSEEEQTKISEFDQIEKTLVSFLRFSDNPSGLHDVEIKGHREDIASSCINGLFKTRESFEKELKSAEINTVHSFFCFLRVLISKASGEIVISTNFSSDGGSIHCLNTHIDRNQILFLLNSSSESRADKLIEMFKKDQEKEGQLEMTIGVGQMHDQPEMLAQSFLEASTALEYRLVRGMGKVIYYKSIPKPDKINLNQLKSHLTHVREAMLTADHDSINASVERIIKLSADLSLSGARYIYWNLIRVIREAMDSYSLSRDEQLLLNDLNVSRLTEFETLDDLRTFITQWLNRIRHLVDDRKPDKYEAICLRVKDYILENSANPQLSLTDISQYTGLSQGHLCRIFKECESVTILKFIKEVRYDLSCSLLRDTAYSVSDIVQQIGYSDAASFTREFKKKYGLTPGQYRSQSISR